MSATPNSCNSPNRPASPVLAPEETDDNDAFNTAGARIHFGPLRSPEKQLGLDVARRSAFHSGNGGSSDLLRRSPRLWPAPTQNLQQVQDTIVQQLEEGIEVVDETPDNEETLLNEPSSALAIRISRAHDNPSPPPGSPTPPPLVDLTSPSPALPFPAILAAPFANSAIDHSEDVSPGLSREPSPALPLTPRANRRGSDLISFESFSTPAPVFRVISPPPQASTSKLQPSSVNPSVVGISAHSPNPATVSEADGPRTLPRVAPIVVSESSPSGDRKGKGRATCDAMLESSGEEEAVLHSLIPDSADSSSPSPISSVEEQRTPTQVPNQPRRSTPHRAATITEDLEMSDATQPSEVEEEKGDTSPHSDTENGQEESTIPTKLAGTARSAQMNSTPKSVFCRELGSLSPTSNDLLSSLVASPSRQPLSFSFNIPESVPTTSEPENILRRPFPIFSQPTLPQTPQRGSTSPVRFASPSRSTAKKMTFTGLKPVALDDPNRTPARRILITEAGHVSPLKDSRLTAGSRSGLKGTLTPMLSIPPTDSPARRVEVRVAATTPGARKEWQAIRFGSPVRGVGSLERLGSTEPPAYASGGKARGAFPLSQPESTKDSSSNSLRAGPSATASTSRPARLPFPIIALEKEPPAIPKETTLECDVAMTSPMKPSQLMSSPAKSSLKQTASRIPRTVKPYARPPPKPERERATVTTMRMVKPIVEVSKHNAFPKTDIDVETGPSSDDAKLQDATSTLRRTVSGTASTASTLKRKRAVPETASPVKARPLVVLRQVPRVAAPTVASSSNQVSVPITVQKRAPQLIRRVVDRPPLESQPFTQAQPSEEAEPSLAEPSQKSQEGSACEIIDSETVGDDDIDTDGPEVALVDVALDSLQDSSAPHHAAPKGVRRTTRVRKTINPTTAADVFGGTSEARPSRRKDTAQLNVRPETFMGMSATALKALTTSNTVRNQRYVAAKLETEIIRKDGARPESPIVKIRTISQRQQDEKGKQRKERAQRRARRSGDGPDYESDEVGGHSGDDSDDSGSDDENNNPAPKRHKRGPGDEDDYQTPVRKLKRLRLGNDSEDSAENERRVKWDRGLFTTIYLDEVKLGTRQPPKDISTKGCLAPTAKALPLDNLGNLPDSPLAELVEESVVVKKFVYDNDIEPVQEVIVVKNTRLRKKAKTPS
ncbi:hypothetical protein DXG03_000873 [Asterophora parasitica]|uniref:Uncharacterized protein n=1 Tax=Asterophora parasitica TaxID=117018 RepID=A0A9P7KC41_9AGAR|nr:hypothetical protein DXG03_000873 [Asterophora parasitica]